MVRYFIKLEDYININPDIDLNNMLLYKRKNGKKNLYFFEKYNVVTDHEINNYLKNVNKYKNSFVVELNNNELDNYNSLIINKYVNVNDKFYKKQEYKKNDNLILLSYDVLFEMNVSELNKGDIVTLSGSKNDSNLLTISINNININENLENKRYELSKTNLFADIYFYTDNSDLIDKYKEYIVILKQVDFNKYKMIKNKLYILDSLKYEDIYAINGECLTFLDILSYNSIPVFINEKDDDIELSLEPNNYYNKKGYIVKNNNLKQMLNNNNISPLLKFLNIYRLENDNYVKSPLKELKDENILKYRKIKK